MTDLRSRVVWLGVQTMLLIVALLAVVGGVALAVYERAEHVDAQERLQAALDKLSPDRTPRGVWLVVVRPDGTRNATPGLPAALDLDAELSAVAADGRARQEEVEAGSGVYFVRTEQRGDDVVQVVMDRTAEERASGRVITALLLAGFVGALLGGVLAGLLARRTLRPVGEALALQRRFVSDAGHELRTPLTLLSTRVQLLARKLDAGKDVRGEVDGVLADTTALNEILEDLLVVAQAGEGQRVVADVVPLARSCLDAAHATAEDRGLTLELAGDESSLCSVVEPAVRRAVTSLLDNALDHARSRVGVRVRSLGRHVEVAVADDGPGVPPELVERLFERFSSERPADATSRRHYGLGLALVAEVAEAHGGSVRVTAPDDGSSGAVFRLRLRR